MIVGIDEVGRGSWAGPLVAGAVLLGNPIVGLADSKLLTRAQRKRLDGEIRSAAKATGIGWVTPAEVDKLGLTLAVRLAMQRALEQIDLPYNEIIIDGSYNFLSDNPKATTLIKADATVAAVSAAAIIAKVARDKYMHEVAKQFPDYGFEKHVGYGTAAHLMALRQFGVSAIHRLSYKPVRAIIENQPG